MRAGDWPQFRGPLGNGVAPEDKAPLHWGPANNVRWKATLPGPGNSSPIVSHGRVFVTCAEDSGKKRNLYCFDRGRANKFGCGPLSFPSQSDFFSPQGRSATWVRLQPAWHCLWRSGHQTPSENSHNRTPPSAGRRARTNTPPSTVLNPMMRRLKVSQRRSRGDVHSLIQSLDWLNTNRFLDGFQLTRPTSAWFSSATIRIAACTEWKFSTQSSG